MTPEQPSPLLTIDETAWMLRRSRRSIERAIAAGDLPAKKLGRRVLIARVDIEAFVASLPPAGNSSTDGGVAP